MQRKQFKKEIFKDYINSWSFKLIFSVICIVSLCGVINYCIDVSYFDGLLKMISTPIIIVCDFFLPLFITTLNIYKIFKKNEFLIIRFKSKKEELKEIMKNILYSNSIMFAISIIVILIGLNLICVTNLGILDKYQFYDIPNIAYAIFYVLRLFIVLIFLSLLNGLLMFKVPSKVIVFLNVLFYGVFLVYPYAPITDGRTSILDSSIIIFEYLQLNSYSNFFTEILCSIFALLLPALLLKILFSLFFKNINLNGFRYLLKSDLSYTLNTKKGLLGFYFIYLIIYSLIKIFVMNYNDNGFNLVLGLEADITNNFLDVIALFLNVLVFILPGTMIFVKDLSKNKSNIFLRIDKTKWSIFKMVSLSLEFAILLVFGYLVTFVIFSLFDSMPTNVITLYFTNLFILILLEIFVLIFIYGNVIFKLVIGLGGLLLLVFNFINISSITGYIGYLVLALVIVGASAIGFFRKNIYKLFESEVLR